MFHRALRAWLPLESRIADDCTLFEPLVFAFESRARALAVGQDVADRPAVSRKMGKRRGTGLYFRLIACKVYLIVVSFHAQEPVMATQIKAARAKSRTPARVKLTPYESDQISQIAAWKSRPPNPIGEIAPEDHACRPPSLSRSSYLMRSSAWRSSSLFELAVRLAGKEDVKRRAGVDDLRDLRNKPLEECDRLALQTGVFSQVFATAQGAATGAGGVLTTLVDIPLLFILSLWTILKIGHCYGYSLDQRRDRHFVLGVLIAAISGTLETKRQRLDELHELEDWLIEETQQEILAEEILSILFQLEIFGAIPGIGAISGGLCSIWASCAGRQHSAASVSGTLAEGCRQGPIDCSRRRCTSATLRPGGPEPWGVWRIQVATACGFGVALPASCWRRCSLETS